VKGLDPIALSEGKELIGLESLEARHGLFRYRFASKENKAAFEAKPEERGIQFGGACGKMGPFSGNGNPARFFVHDGRIYVFASEGCRDAFKKDPEKHIERPNPVPEGSAEQRKRGAELLDLTLNGFGGAKRVDGLKTLQEMTRHAYKQGDKETVSKYQVAWAFPDRVRIVEEFSVPYGFVVDGRKGHQISGKESLTLETSMREVAWRQALRQPLAMLKNRDAKGFVAIAKGPGKVGETAVELLAVALHGATSTWSVEAKTGRILQVQYEARRGTVGDNVVTFADFRDVDGLIMPYQRATFFNGKAVSSPEASIERIVPNGELKPEIFMQSK
jgi:YHS domain-containing protein